MGGGKTTKQGEAVQHGQHLLLRHPLRIVALRARGRVGNGTKTTSEFTFLLYSKLQEKMYFHVSS